MSKQIEVMYSAEQIDERIREMGRQISEDYQGKEIHCLGVLKGSFMFMADLFRHIENDLTCDFLTISSYGDQTMSSGVVKLVADLAVPIKDRHVIVIEDIVDTGLTLGYLLDNLKTRLPASISVCSFLSKPTRRRVDVSVDYCGFEIPDKFVVGYGMDAAQKYRNLPYLGVVTSEG